MSKVIADISMSLDGYVTAAGVDQEHGLGVGGEVIHAWVLEEPRSPVTPDQVAGSTAALGTAPVPIAITRIPTARSVPARPLPRTSGGHRQPRPSWRPPTSWDCATWPSRSQICRRPSIALRRPASGWSGASGSTRALGDGARPGRRPELPLDLPLKGPRIHRFGVRIYTHYLGWPRSELPCDRVSGMGDCPQGGLTNAAAPGVSLVSALRERGGQQAGRADGVNGSSSAPAGGSPGGGCVARRHLLSARRGSSELARRGHGAFLPALCRRGRLAAACDRVRGNLARPARQVPDGPGRFTGLAAVRRRRPAARPSGRSGTDRRGGNAASTR
jgi:hypothetical protein